MGETSNLALMAEKISTEIFSVFGWKKVGPVNQNWSCVDKVLHAKQRAPGTHPSDVVYRFRDPYKGEDVYVTSDLKSYAKNSISTTALKAALLSLARSVDCAQKSDIFAELFITDENSWRVDGMLFIYNHDGEYDQDFPSVLVDCKVASLPIPRGRSLQVIGPEEVCYLNTVAADILRNVALERASLDSVRFFAPDLAKTPVTGSQCGPATLKMLVDPWLFTTWGEGEGFSGKCTIYYRERGETVEEFEYLIDCILHFQLLGDNSAITIRMPNACGDAAVMFEKAKDLYASSYHGMTNESLKDFERRLGRISCQSVTNVVTHFSESEIGMEVR